MHFFIFSGTITPQFGKGGNEIMKTVACRIDLGYTRIAGYTLFDQESLEFKETTPKEAEGLIRAGKLNGLKFDGTGSIVPDLDGWNLGNMKIKSGVGNYRNFNTDNPKGDTVYSVVRAIDIDGVGRIYETINNRCARVFYLEKQLAALSQFAWVGGIKINEDTDEITLCQGVQVDNQSDRVIFEVGTKALTKEQLQEATMAELFSANGAAQAETVEAAAAEAMDTAETVEENKGEPADETAMPFESDTAEQSEPMQPVGESDVAATDTADVVGQEENNAPAVTEAQESVVGNESTEEVTEQAEESKEEAPMSENAPEEDGDGEQNWQPKSSYSKSGSKSSKKKK